MKRLIISVVLALTLLMVPVSGALAAEDTVTVTATPSFVAIANSHSDYDFSVIAESSTENTGTGYFTLTNTSTVVTDVTLSCVTWSGTSSWTYGASDADTGQLKASGDNPGAGGSGGAGTYNLVIPTSGSVLLNDDLPATTNVAWEMQLDAPSSFSHGYEQTTTVTITATAIP